MTVIELGALGEFLGSIGVIATLIYLAAQIRQNTKATRASVRQGVTNQSSKFIRAGLDNHVVAAARTKQRLNEPLDPHEENQLADHQHLNFRGFESTYAQYKSGLFSEPEWRAFEDIIFSLFRRNKYARDMWKRTGQATRAFEPDFIEVVEAIRLRAEGSEGEEPRTR